MRALEPSNNYFKPSAMLQESPAEKSPSKAVTVLGTIISDIYGHLQ
ncbi:MAG: hypothetical protein ACJAS9_000217 [Polaribacter sp.]|jgi:hypothetical protein